MQRADQHASRALPRPAQVRLFRKLLLAWFRDAGRQFYWRGASASEYERIVVEVLLQRTQAASVESFLPRFLSHFPTWEALAGAEQGALEELLRPLGLWRRRAAALSGLACARVGAGAFPSERTALERFPAVGQYVANAVELFVFNGRKPLVDSNFARIIERYFGQRVRADIRRDPWIQEIAHRLVDDEKAIDINWAILDLGAVVCKPRTPACTTCPLRVTCKYARSLEASSANDRSTGT